MTITMAFIEPSVKWPRAGVGDPESLPRPAAYGMVRPLHYIDILPFPRARAMYCFFFCRRSSGVEHTLGKGGVGRSIRPGGTINPSGVPCPALAAELLCRPCR